MVVRAYKHILKAFVSAVDNVAAYLAASIASSLNLLLGTPFPENPDAVVEKISADPHTYKTLTPLTME